MSGVAGASRQPRCKLQAQSQIFVPENWSKRWGHLKTRSEKRTKTKSGTGNRQPQHPTCVFMQRISQGGTASPIVPPTELMLRFTDASLQGNPTTRFSLCRSARQTGEAWGRRHIVQYKTFRVVNGWRQPLNTQSCTVSALQNGDMVLLSCCASCWILAARVRTGAVICGSTYHSFARTPPPPLVWCPLVFFCRRPVGACTSGTL